MNKRKAIASKKCQQYFRSLDTARWLVTAYDLSFLWFVKGLVEERSKGRYGKSKEAS